VINNIGVSCKVFFRKSILLDNIKYHPLKRVLGKNIIEIEDQSLGLLSAYNG
jgi:hypothetical protein